MNQYQRTFFLASLLTLALAAGACTPIVAPSDVETTETPAASESAADVATLEDSATATVATRSLRVRAEPTESAEVIVGIAEGEQYPVLGMSSDGLWVQLAIDTAPGGSGWVSANFVTIEGPITDTPTIEVTPVDTVTSTEPSTDTVTTGVISTDTVTSGVTSTDTVTAEVTSEITTTEPITPVVTPAPGFAVVVTDGTRLRVRTTASADGEIAGYVYNNETYQVLEISPDGLWVRIAGSTDGSNPDNPNGGWVAAEFVIIGQ